MTWSASLLPDDALPPDSLVRRIIDADKVRPELLSEAEKFLEEYADDFKALAASEKAELIDRALAAINSASPVDGSHLSRFSLASEDLELIEGLLAEQARIARGESP